MPIDFVSDYEELAEAFGGLLDGLTRAAIETKVIVAPETEAPEPTRATVKTKTK